MVLSTSTLIGPLQSIVSSASWSAIASLTLIWCRRSSPTKGRAQTLTRPSLLSRRARMEHKNRACLRASTLAGARGRSRTSAWAESSAYVVVARAAVLAGSFGSSVRLPARHSRSWSSSQAAMGTASSDRGCARRLLLLHLLLKKRKIKGDQLLSFSSLL